MYSSCRDNKKDWAGYTLIVPAISVGNVGQLSCDLIINTLEMQHEGYLYDESILPIVGGDAFATGDVKHCLTTACQVYESSKHKLAVIQQRSPIVRGKKSLYVTRLTQWIKQSQFTDVIILTSIFAHERIDQQLQGSQFRYLSSETYKQHHSDSMTDMQSLEPRPAPVGDAEGLYLPGGGAAKAVHKKCQEEEIPSCILLRFCAEGDNMYDAMELASYCNTIGQWIDLKTTSWKTPSSWRLPFGSRFEQILYQ